jgi:hypothetical protein
VTTRTFDEFVGTLAPLTSPEASVSPEREVAIREAVAAVEVLPTVDRASLAALVHDHPEWVPVLGLVIGLSQEQLKNQLRYHAQTSSWRRLARDDADRLIAILDSADMRIVEQLDRQRQGSYTFADVLIARAGSRERAGRAITRGRQLEDLVEAVVQRLNVTYETRTRFLGRGGEDAPCDVAIPEGGEYAAIVIAVKGFDSTGSKLTDAVREVVDMAQKRRPRQFVYAVVDGIGWLNRQADLRRIYKQWEDNNIDGLYTLATFAEFEEDLTQAVQRLGMS